MAAIGEQEVLRLAEQERLDCLKHAAERNQWGQFATPPILAREIAEYACQLRQTMDGEPLRFLEPALGTGAFYSALLQASSPTAIESAMGVELDPLFAETARKLWAPTGMHVVEGDFTALDPPGRFNLILTNPPYVRHHHLGLDAKERLRQHIAADLRLKLSGLAGLYCYFMLLADKWLDAGGLSVWLVPTEFMTVNYGRAVKDYLLRRVSLRHIHRFCPADVQFADALVSSAVVVFQKSPPRENHRVRFSFGGNLKSPQFEQYVEIADLEREAKWTRFAEPELVRNNGNAEHASKLGDFFSIKRGIATGDNCFFVLERAEAERRGIPQQFCRPILPSPRRLSETVIEVGRDGYPLTNPQLCVIDCQLTEREIEAEYPRFWRYLLEGKQSKVNQGYLTSRRIPWYSQEKREPAPYLCSYMGRASRDPERSPFRFFWNKSNAIAANVYLLLYPRPLLKQLLDDNPDLYAAVFEVLSQIAADHCMEESRVYGGGLYKLEPSELANVSAEQLMALLGTLPHQSQGLLFA